MHSGVMALSHESGQDRHGSANGAVFMGVSMNLSAPKVITFLLSLICVALAIVSRYTPIPQVTPNAFWVAIIGYVLLLLGVTMKGL
jgi:threonine/homoserine/homoserine lactone efflux protein